MKIRFLLMVMLGVFLVQFPAMALNYSYTVGDMDYGADRNANDVATNMDHYVFPTFVTPNPDWTSATNTLGFVEWDYVLPNEILSANSGSMEVRAWDIDPLDEMKVYFNFGSSRVFAGQLLGSNGGIVEEWEDAVANGTTDSLDGWSTTTFDFSQELLDALADTSAFVLELEVLNQTSDGWAAVVDFATIHIDYEPGAPNPGTAPVPEPGTWMLMLAGLAGLAGVRKFGPKKRS